MRDYSKVSPTFWTGSTGKAVKRLGRDAQVLAFYLITGPSANWIGMYYLPIPTICHETGLSIKGATKALQCLSEVGFVKWDGASEHVFVPEMAAHQIGASLKPTDHQVKGIAKAWATMRKSPFYMDFYRRYRDAYHLPTPSFDEGPSKPHRSQEQEMEQEQDVKGPIQESGKGSEGSAVARLVAVNGGRS